MAKNRSASLFFFRPEISGVSYFTVLITGFLGPAMNFSPTGDFAVLLRSTEAAARLHWLHHQAREGISAKKKSKLVRTLQGNVSHLGKGKIIDSKMPAEKRTCEFPMFPGGYVLCFRCLYGIDIHSPMSFENLGKDVECCWALDCSSQKW